MGGKSDTQTTTQETKPWEPAIGDLTNILGQARNLYNRGSSYYPNSTVVPFSGQTEQALQGMEQKAIGGNPLYGQGQAALTSGLDTLQRTASGQMLNSNPYLSDMFNAMSGDVTDAVNSQFSAYGRTGSPAHAGVMTKELGNLASQIWGQDYQRERQNQLSAAGQMPGYTSAIPGYQQAGYADLERLAGVGAAREGKAGETLQDLVSRWNFEQESPWQNLMRYGQIAQGIGGMGQTGTNTQKIEYNPFGSILGGLFGGIGALKDTGAFGPTGWL